MNSLRQKGISSSSSSSAADFVASNDDLITEILLRLPVKTVVTFKLVSKRWRSLISDCNFVIRHSRRHSNKVSGLILDYSLRPQIRSSNFIYLPFDQTPPESAAAAPTKFTPLDPHAPGPIRISHSCNGLLLCYGRRPFFRGLAPLTKLYVFNPTTNQFSTLCSPEPPPGYNRIPESFSLAYDPSSCPFYRVVCIRFSQLSCNIQIYSSATGAWDGNHEIRPFSGHACRGVFLNGAINWMSFFSGHCYRFDLDQKCLQKLPTPPLPEIWKSSNFKYFGEFQGSLHFIAFDRSEYVIFEMNRNCSEWFVKHRLNIDLVVAAFPGISEANTYYSMRRRLRPLGLEFYISMLSLFEDKSEGTKLVMYIPGKVVTYCFKDNTFKQLWEFHGSMPRRILWYNAFNYTETLCSI